MDIQLTLIHPAYLARNGIFRFPQDADRFEISVVARVVNTTVNGLAEDDVIAVDALGLAPVVDHANIIWIAQGSEQADVDGELDIEITQVILENWPDDQPEVEQRFDEEEEMDDDEARRAELTFIPDESAIDPDDYDDSDELLAKIEAESGEELDARIDARRREMELDLSDELVGKKLRLEFTAGVLVQWSLN